VPNVRVVIFGSGWRLRDENNFVQDSVGDIWGCMVLASACHKDSSAGET